MKKILILIIFSASIISCNDITTFKSKVKITYTNFKIDTVVINHRGFLTIRYGELTDYNGHRYASDVRSFSILEDTIK